MWRDLIWDNSPTLTSWVESEVFKISDDDDDESIIIHQHWDHQTPTTYLSVSTLCSLLNNFPKMPVFDTYPTFIEPTITRVPSTVLDLPGLAPLWCLSTPQVCIDPQKNIVKISQKYIADPPLVFLLIEYCSSGVIWVHVAWYKNCVEYQWPTLQPLNIARRRMNPKNSLDPRKDLGGPRVN